MPMVIPTNGVMMEMPDSFFFDQNHLNLIFDGRYKKTKIRINLESRHAFSTFDGDTGASGRPSVNGSMTTGSDDNVGSFRIAEVYGGHDFNQYAKFRAGSFYSPFGIYNEIRYATPLFATVVLPFIYELPPNYTGTILVPSNANLMISGGTQVAGVGIKYNLYASQGQRYNNNEATFMAVAQRGRGQETNNEKGIGARLQFDSRQKYKVGLSYFYDDPEVELTTPAGRLKNGLLNMQLMGIDLDLELPWNLRLEAEYVSQNRTLLADGTQGDKAKYGYYIRLIYEEGAYIPFLMYDVFNDNNDALYKFENHRLGTGFGYQVSKNFYLKTEYHYHWWSERPTGNNNSVGPSITHMIRTSSIFYF